MKRHTRRILRAMAHQQEKARDIELERKIGALLSGIPTRTDKALSMPSAREPRRDGSHMLNRCWLYSV